MLDNHGTTPVGRSRPFQATTHQLALVFDSSANRHIREMLRVYEPRTSLFRLKVINTLVQATREGRLPGVRGVHADMQASSSELTIVSVREVLKRLAGVGVIVSQPDRTYRFTDEAWEMLKPHLG